MQQAQLDGGSQTESVFVGVIWAVCKHESLCLIIIRAVDYAFAVSMTVCKH